mmetsp:Transcript_39931/g.109889  ORF Transcript_39931/g.109889 Transcript_39931/m.109889 type:complete len:203 (+) Transcript_39931:51-659(+)
MQKAGGIEIEHAYYRDAQPCSPFGNTTIPVKTWFQNHIDELCSMPSKAVFVKRTISKQTIVPRRFYGRNLLVQRLLPPQKTWQVLISPQSEVWIVLHISGEQAFVWHVEWRAGEHGPLELLLHMIMICPIPNLTFDRYVAWLNIRMAANPMLGGVPTGTHNPQLSRIVREVEPALPRSGDARKSRRLFCKYHGVKKLLHVLT